MTFIETDLAGAYIIELDRHKDDRGYFARKFCEKEFHQQGLQNRFVQTNISYNKKKGTLRGMHYQVEPFSEVKVVTCISGEIYDVIIDLRENSKTRNKWIGCNLSSTNLRALYIPKGFAHGFQTLKNETVLHYQMGDFFQPGYAEGIRWDDPFFNIEWPLAVNMISEKDKSYRSYYNV